MTTTAEQVQEMAEQAHETMMQRRMKDFVAGASWVPAAPGPSGHGRPARLRWADSPVVKWTLDAADRLDPARDHRAALRAAGADAAAQARAVMRHGVAPALEAVRDELVADGYEVELEVTDGERARLSVVNYNGSRTTYEVAARTYAEPVASLADVHRNAGRMRPVIEINSRGRQRTRSPRACSQRAIARDCRHEVCRVLLW